MNVTPGTLVFITLVVLIAGYLIFRPRKKKATEESERPAPSRDSSPAPTVSVLKENPRERLTDWLRKQKVANLSLDTHTTLATAMIEFSERVTVDNIVRGALQVGYSPSEVSTFMLSQGYELGEVAGVLVDEENLEVRELADIVMPLAQGSTVAERAEKTFEIVKAPFTVEDDDEDFLELPAHMGCSKEESVVILYRQTGLNLGAVIRLLKLDKEPDTVARIAKTLEVDLSDSNEYEELRRDDEIDFEVAARILKACGFDAETILSTEHSFNEFSDDQLEDAFTPLVTAGFSKQEILIGLSRAEIVGDNSSAILVQFALDENISMDDIIRFLKNEDVDVDTMDEEMRELDMETETRINVLHALIHFNTPTSSEPESAEEVLDQKIH